MDIVIFKEVTTEGVITSIEENSKKYHEGFFADMNNAPERKLVKESSADIKGIIKELEAKRITINRDNTTNTNKECQAIVDRLEVANSPFTKLEDDYKAERKVILDAEKALKQAIINAEQKECDHEMALLINKTFEYDRAEELRLQLCKDLIAKQEREDYAAEQVKLSEERQIENQAYKRQNEVDAENARLANKEHCAKVNNTILACLLNEGFDENESKKFIRLAAQNKLPQLTINY